MRALYKTSGYSRSFSFAGHTSTSTIDRKQCVACAVAQRENVGRLRGLLRAHYVFFSLIRASATVFQL